MASPTTASPANAGREIAVRPIGYLVVALITAAAGYGIAVRVGVDSSEAAGALAAAWMIQAIAFGLLVPRLREGRDAIRAWATGIGLRVGSLLAAWPLTAVGLLGRDAAAAYGLCLAALMILEAIWLGAVTAAEGPKE